MNKIVYSEEEIKISVLRVKDKLKQFINAKKSYTLQDFFKLSNYFFGCELAVFNTILEYATKSESVSPFSSKFFFSRFLLDKSLDFSEPKRFRKEHLYKMFESISLDKDISNILFDAVNLAGVSGKITLAKSTATSSILELKLGSFFESMKPSFLVKNVVFNDPRVICIDGYLESVSEINKLLTTSFDKKEIILLFIRGLSEDVLHTLKVNFDRCTVRIIPFVVTFDLDGANLLNDVAVISGCDVISTHKGELITNVCYDNSRMIDSIEISDSGILLKNSSRDQYVNLHIKQLQTKILETEADFTKDAIAKRIKSLGSRNVRITLPDNTNKYNFDTCLRCIKSATDFGVIEEKNEIYPFAALQAAQHYSMQLENVLLSLGSIIM